VQTTGYCVATATKFSSGVKNCQYNFNRRLFLNRVHIHWDSTTVVGDFDPALGGYKHVDVIAVTGESFVNRVVDDFINEVVKTTWTSGADVHTRTFANSLKPFENLDVA
jgi:hypothetical protein